MTFRSSFRSTAGYDLIWGHHRFLLRALELIILQLSTGSQDENKLISFCTNILKLIVCVTACSYSFTSHTIYFSVRIGQVVPVLKCRKIWGECGIAPRFLASALAGGEWAASLTCRFTSGAHWIGGWMGPRSHLDAVEKRNNLHCRESNPWRPACIPSLFWLSYPHSIHAGVRL
jgi:hypothetical protein